MRDLFAKAAADDGNIMRRVDARTKLGITLTAALITIVCSGAISQLVLFAATFAYVCLINRPKLVFILYAFMAVMMGIAGIFASILGYYIPEIGGLSVKSLLVPFLRGLSMMNVVMVLALTTKVEDLLSTLERMHLPFCIFLPTVVMIRFIPTFANDIKQVWETLRIKGWPLGPAMLTFQPLLSARLVLAPILFRALKSSETLGVASELKGLGAGKRTLRPTSSAMLALDKWMMAVSSVVVITVILCEIFFRSIWMSGVGMP